MSLENEHLAVVINGQTGDLVSIFSKKLDRELLSGPGNQLQAFRDQGQYWDAWNIDPDYANHPLPPTQLVSIDAIERGPIEWRTRVIRRLGASRCQHDYVLHRHSDTLYIETQIDWQEDHVLLKVAFPLTLDASHATYEAPCGSITRTTNPQTEAEKAQWEVPALRWANLTDDSGEWGVSLLNDCKYGYDVQPSQLRLTLLRSSNWPEVGCDRGHQTMTYALYAHRGTVSTSQTVKRGYELQMPLLVHSIPKLSTRGNEPPFVRRPDTHTHTHTHTPGLPSQATLLSLGANSLVLSAFKQSEADPGQWIGRCYEATGQRSHLTLSSDLGLRLGLRVNGLEDAILQSGAGLIAPAEVEILPWQIQAFQIKPTFSSLVQTQQGRTTVRPAV
ncbi:MAG: hypothetical protein HC771_17730 [Synechococcales cyanobacterium CRU_2_2]|nr:hypothetical protein [Synechococcales cyanobacterium CRU_2_2]